MATSRIRLELSEVEIAAIAQRVAAIIVSGGAQPRGESPQRFLTPAEAAQYLRSRANGSTTSAAPAF